jgi:hypothetical protein
MTPEERRDAQREPRGRWRNQRLADILHRMRHDGCGGRAGKAELLTGIDGLSRSVGSFKSAARICCENSVY